MRDVSGYAKRPRDFEDLVEILDGELRLITPAEPRESEVAGTACASDDLSDTDNRRDQLTHDYLVSSLRRWLTLKQQETRRGRAELRLAELEAIWSTKPEERLLPRIWDWARISFLTDTRCWTTAQRKMMGRATRHYAFRFVLAVIAVFLLAWAGYEVHGSMKATALVDQLKSSEISEVSTILQELSAYRRWAEPRLEAMLRSPPDSRERLLGSLALVDSHPERVGFVCDRMLDTEPDVLSVVCRRLTEYRGELVPGLWNHINNEEADPTSRFRAAQALAVLDPPAQSEEQESWERQSAFIADQLVDQATANPNRYSTLVADFRSTRGVLYPRLQRIYRDSNSGRRSMATSMLADFFGDDPQVFCELLLDADIIQFDSLLPKLKPFRSQTVDAMQAALKASRSASSTAEDNYQVHHEVNAAVALLRLGAPDEVWPLFRFSTYPNVRSTLICRCSHYGVAPTRLLGAPRHRAGSDGSTCLVAGPWPIRQELIQFGNDVSDSGRSPGNV